MYYQKGSYAEDHLLRTEDFICLKEFHIFKENTTNFQGLKFLKLEGNEWLFSKKSVNLCKFSLNNNRMQTGILSRLQK